MRKLLRLNIIAAIAASGLLTAYTIAFAAKSGNSSSSNGSANSGSTSSDSGKTNAGTTKNTATGHATGRRVHKPFTVTTPVGQ